MKFQIVCLSSAVLATYGTTSCQASDTCLNLFNGIFNPQAGGDVNTCYQLASSKCFCKASDSCDTLITKADELELGILERDAFSRNSKRALIDSCNDYYVGNGCRLGCTTMDSCGAMRMKFRGKGEGRGYCRELRQNKLCN